MIEVRNYIGGEWVSVRQGRELEVRNPANQDELVGHGFLASPREAELATHRPGPEGIDSPRRTPWGASNPACSSHSTA